MVNKRSKHTAEAHYLRAGKSYDLAIKCYDHGNSKAGDEAFKAANEFFLAGQIFESLDNMENSLDGIESNMKSISDTTCLPERLKRKDCYQQKTTNDNQKLTEHVALAPDFLYGPSFSPQLSFHDW